MAVPILIMTMKISYLQEKNLFLRGFNAAVILCQKRGQNAGERRKRKKQSSYCHTELLSKS